jgi:hypothetical protein
MGNSIYKLNNLCNYFDNYTYLKSIPEMIVSIVFKNLNFQNIVIDLRLTIVSIRLPRPMS